MTLADDKHYRARITRRVDFSPELWMIRIRPDGVQPAAELPQPF